MQSPSAYSFIRYVINEHYPYYAYKEFKCRYKGYSKLFCKIGRLLFRLSNYWQPEVFLANTELFDGFVNAGCVKTTCLPLSAAIVDEDSAKEYGALSGHHIIFVDVRTFKGDVNKLLGVCTVDTMLIMAGLFPKHKNVWHEIKESKFTGVTYNLYYCGIVFFDKSKYKQHYEVNF